MTFAAALLVSVLAVAPPGPPPGQSTFTGVIADDICAVGGHAQMRMGPTDAECTMACVESHDATLVLVDGEHVYKLSDQRTSRAFAGQQVRVVGTLDTATNTIQVESVTPH